MLVLWSCIPGQGHIRPNRKFALTSFSKSFFIFPTCFHKVTGSLPKSLPVKASIPIRRIIYVLPYCCLKRRSIWDKHGKSHAHTPAAHAHLHHSIDGSKLLHAPCSPFSTESYSYWLGWFYLVGIIHLLRTLVNRKNAKTSEKRLAVSFSQPITLRIKTAFREEPSFSRMASGCSAITVNPIFWYSAIARALPSIISSSS